MAEIYYFGCWKRAGHYLVDRSNQEPRGPGAERLPKDYHLDATPLFLPHPERVGVGALTYLPACDLTVLAWWGSPWDKRGKVNAAIMIRGQHDADIVWRHFKENFPAIAPELQKPSVASHAAHSTPKET